MSERSKRRDLEMAVIERAIDLDIHHQRWAPGTGGWSMDAEDERTRLKYDLHQAVVAYCEYGLANLDKPRAVLRAPETSHDAAEWAKQFALTDAGAVFRQIYYRWHRVARAYWANDEGAPNEGLTSDEIESDLNRTHQSISARVNALKDAGWIIDSGHRRKTRSGRDAIVWTPSQAARDFVDECGMPIPVSP